VDWIPAIAEQAGLRAVAIEPAARTTSCGIMWLSVPIWSSLPQRPQFLSFSVASAMAFLPTVIFIRPFPSTLPDGAFLPDFARMGETGGTFPVQQKK
jgi:hypothetical protein